MPILHGANGSPFVRKVKVALAEKSVAFDQEPLIPFGVSDEYKKKSPLGKIPCWEDGDFVLPDSSCILAYLERSQSTPSLYPSDPKQFARALWYEEYGDTKLVEVCGPPFFERVIKGGFLQQEPDEERVAKVIAEEQPPVFDYLEGEVGDREYLVGTQFSVADIATASPFVNLMHAGAALDASRWPKLGAYLERIHSRPSFKACIEEEKAAFSGGRS
jgi:glutathione S-transferase